MVASMLRRCLLPIVLALVPVGVALALTGTAQAQTPVPTPTPPPGDGVITQTTTVTNIFRLLFPFDTMYDGVVQLSANAVGGLNTQAEVAYGDSLQVLISSRFGIAPSDLGGDLGTTPLLSMVWPFWDATFRLSLMLLPATLALTTVVTLRGSVMSATRWADVKEAVLGWLFSALATAGSFYAIALASRLTLSFARNILSAGSGGEVSGQSLTNVFFNLNLLTGSRPEVILFVGLFVLFLAAAILIGLELALAAYLAATWMLTSIAPLVMAIGVLPPLRWIYLVWLKAIAITLLLPVVDALLLRSAILLGTQMFTEAQGGIGGLGLFFVRLLITCGVLSLLVGINWKAGEAMFGALGQVGQQFMVRRPAWPRWRPSQSPARRRHLVSLVGCPAPSAAVVEVETVGPDF